MTDPIPTPATPVAAGPKQTQSVVSFVLGIAAVVFSWTGIIGIGAGIAAIILSSRAKKSEPAAPSWMKTLGLVLGIVGIVLGLILGIISLLSFIALATLGSYGSYGN